VLIGNPSTNGRSAAMDLRFLPTWVMSSLTFAPRFYAHMEPVPSCLVYPLKERLAGYCRNEVSVGTFRFSSAVETRFL